MAPADFQGVPEDDQPGAPAPQDKINFVKEAFHLQYNWIAMERAGAFELLGTSFIPVILAPRVPAEMATRYVHAAQVSGASRTNFAEFSSTSQIFLQQIDSRLQGLLN